MVGSYNRDKETWMEMKSKMRKRSVLLVAALALVATIVVLATPGSTAASGGSYYIQAGWAQWYPSYADCVGCWVRFVDNNTGVISSVKVGDLTGPGHYTAELNPAHEYHIYLYYQGDFCPAFSLPNPDIIPPYPNLTYGGIAPGRDLLLLGSPSSPSQKCPQ
jgi:roadblock/LC7 domain-containing protein